MVTSLGSSLNSERIRYFLGWISLCLILLGIGGCQSIGSPAPVEDRSTYPPAPRGFYRIRSGDTLSRIARWHGIPMERLAEWNHLEPPYPIRAGALLRIQPPSAQTVVSTPQKEKPAQQPPPAQQPSPKTTPKPPGSKKPVAKSKPVKNTGAVPKQSRKKTQAKQQQPKKKSKASKPKKKTPAPKTSARKLRWRWPLRGRIVQTFNHRDRTRQGIRIAAPLGTAVRAAEAGTVVYSGSGLKGYGNLIILKHNPHYLSVYGFNRRLRVTQGMRVKRGQVIGEVGRAPSGKFCLHFEIRRDGQAVNPLAYLGSP